jgi:hypothetical protein
MAACVSAAGVGALHLAFAWDIFGAASPLVTGAASPLPGALNPDGQGHRFYSNAMVIAGAVNAVIDQWIASCKAIQTAHPGIVICADIFHEPDLTDKAASVLTDPATYAQMAAYVIDRFNAAGVRLEWAFVTSGYVTGNTTTPAGVLSANALYNLLYGTGTSFSGDTRYTWLGTDPYIDGPDQDASKFYSQWFARVDAGMLGPIAAAKPKMLGEYGIGQAALNAAALWTSVPGALKDKIALAQVFDSANGAPAGGWQNFALTGTAQAAYVAMTESL